MSIKLATDRVTLHGNCSLEDADSLFEWLHNNESGVADLAAVEHLHATVLQAFMASSNEIVVAPGDRFSAECLRQARLRLGSELVA